jgi:hypothetical protein
MEDGSCLSRTRGWRVDASESRQILLLQGCALAYVAMTTIPMVLTSLLVLVSAVPLAARDRTPLRVKVTFHSDPEGATVYGGSGQQRMGTTPVSVTYKKLPRSFKDGSACAPLLPVLMRWASGAEA